nr:alpha/beta hydrolase [Bacteroidota bacterium]
MKKDIVLLHGALGAADQFAELITVLSKAYNVLAFDFSGHGNTAMRLPFSISLFAEEAKQL